MKLLIAVLAMSVSFVAHAEENLCRSTVETAVLAAEAATAKGTYWNEDCEENCDQLTQVKITSTKSVLQKNIQPDDLVGKYIVTTSSSAAHPQKAEYVVIYRSYDIGRCTVLRIERQAGQYALPHDVLEKLK